MTVPTAGSAARAILGHLDRSPPAAEQDAQAVLGHLNRTDLVEMSPGRRLYDDQMRRCYNA